MPASIRILVTDDHAVLRAGLTALLNAEADFTVVGEAADGGEALRIAQAVQPDVILLDINMPGVNGLDALPLLRQATPKSRILVLTMHDDITYLRQVLRAGGAGYVLKQAADKELLSAIRTVYNGGTFLHPSHAQALLNNPAPPAAANAGDDALAQLSEREQETLRP
jgi:DNA-binding NarL/FixJ family response regulator